MEFNHTQAFTRAIGWISNQELEELRTKHIAIGGTGGTGGYYALTLARLGIEHFTLADADNFELSNLNRQAGAFMGTLGKNKAHIIANMLTDINPNIKVRIFAEGVSTSNVDEFLVDVDLYLNAMGLQSVDVQESIFESCRRRQVPGTTAIVPGMGVAVINFHPRRTSFEQYFRVRGLPHQEQAIRLLVGHDPRVIARRYILSDEGVRLKEKDAPAPVVPMSCVLAAGVACTEVLKILLNRKKPLWAPWSIQADAYLRKFHRTYRPGGNGNVLNKIVLTHMRKRLGLPPVD
jgi:molybdopterin/thiamine biosynthesis adenylyltransferase